MILGKLAIGDFIVIENLVIPDDVVRFLVGAFIGMFPLIIKFVYSHYKEQKCK